ncbi:MAG: DNA polymerase III subunit chi [Gammaproteobacteria bacterium]|nr:DNA polymerase III subunit chi [Gammaproteobacteria bacterium]MBU1647084.1 DNA polymerase III subunit chi [Gammaproteobacteria bacterium]MBU1972596.1 DNA polymerase III subunit chi [Gammaproteobacteria bacterium]
MTRILFLHGASDRLAAAARWLNEAAAAKRKVLVYVPQADAATQLDRLLWTQVATGFVPHALAGSPLAAESPIVITDRLDAIPHDKALLNLGDELPSGFSRFEELIELISSDDAVRLPARERFKFYRERGYAPESREVGT